MKIASLSALWMLLISPAQGQQCRVSCPGVMVHETIDFTVDADGKPLRVGQVPSRLPHGIIIHGELPELKKAPDNDLALFDTRLITKGEGLAVAIRNKKGGKSRYQGGTIYITFEEPVFSVNAVRILDLEPKQRKGFITGKGIYSEKFPSIEAPPSGVGRAVDITPTNWFNTVEVKVVFPGVSAVSSLDVSFCRPKIPGKIGNRFRTFDGKENKGGATGAPLLRKAPVSYPGDGSGSTIRTEPNPRDVSNQCARQEKSIPDKRGLTNMVWAFGQFLDHDLDLSLASASAGDLTINVTNPKDPLFPSIPAFRSIFEPGTGTARHPRRQTNAITSSIDASAVYGSSLKRANALRSFHSGLLKVTARGKHILPPLQDPESDLHNEGRDKLDELFLAGDIRINEQLTLTAMHTLFIREHNRLARKIGQEYPKATDEEIYQFARKLVAAEIQKITYSEFLPALMGRERVPRYRGYVKNVDISIATEFSMGGYRFGHSMLPPQLQLIHPNGRQLQAVPLRQAFFRPSFFLEMPRRVDFLIHGLIQTTAQQTDLQVIDDVRNFLFGKPGKGGLDLVSLNIQRGRDHGLATYGEARQAYGLPEVRHWHAVTRDPERRACLQRQYGPDPGEMDLWVGVLAEDPPTNASVGPLLIRILHDQFARLRNGDAFYYEQDPDFRTAELKYILDMDSLKLSDVIQWNTGISLEKGQDVFRNHA